VTGNLAASALIASSLQVLDSGALRALTSGLDMLSEADVNALLDQGSVVRGDFAWRKVGRTNWRADCVLEECYDGARVKLTATLNSRIRNISFSLVWASNRVRGLDVGGPAHPNPDGEVLETPHKHRWTDRHGEREAYKPTDIDATSDLRSIFQQFLSECNIRFEGSYFDPVEQVDWVAE
jgi:hypothetical protein